MSQPRATKSLQEAEHEVGVQLFYRTNRGLTATVAGEAAIRHARLVLVQIKHMGQEIQGMEIGAGAHLRIGTIMGAVPYVVETIQNLLKKYPKTSVEILEDTSAVLLRLLDRGELDVVVGRHTVSSSPNAYTAIQFHDEVLNVVTSPEHPLANQKRVRLEDLSKSRWIVYTAAMPMRLALEREYQLAGLEFPTSILETRSALTTMALIKGNPNLIALLSGDVAAFFINYGMAVSLPLHLRIKSEPYEAITHKAQHLSDMAEQFIAELTSGTAHNR